MPLPTLLFRSLALSGLLQVVAAPALAEEADAFLIERGEARLTVADMDGRMSRLPASSRAEFAFRPENLAQMMDRLLLNRQLSIQARAEGLDQDPAVRRDLELAVEEVLAAHRLNQVTEAAIAAADIEQLARERFLTQQDTFKVPAQRVVQHLLIGTEQRSEEEALARASELLRQARSPGSDFDAMVMEYSEDPGKGSNQGRYTMAQPGQYVPEFEAAGLALQRPGEFAEPVKTQFGYHLMRLIEVTPERTRSFEEVRDELVLKVEEEVAQGARERLVQELKSLPDRGDDDRLVGLRARYGGEPAKPAQ